MNRSITREPRCILVCIAALLSLVFCGPSRSKVWSQETNEESQSFSLLVLGPDSQPVSNAKVEVRTRPAPDDSWVQNGEFVRSAKYGSFVKTDSEGRIVLTVPRKAARRLNISIQTDGFAPYWTGWSAAPSKTPLPKEFTAMLDSGRAVGGVVVDELGQPVEGALVHPSIRYKKRPGDQSSLWVGKNFKTNPEGKWSFAFMPADQSSLNVEIKHPAFMATRATLSLDIYGLKSGQDASQPIVLKKGLVLVGRVTDPDGKPIAGALVRSKFGNDEREVKTGLDGVYELPGCRPEMAKIVVTAKGMAVEMQERRIAPEMGPLDFAMMPGRTIRLRVVDREGKPVPKTRVFFQGWRSPDYDYFELDHVHQYTDENGVWVWEEAPQDEIRVDICPPGRMTLTDQSIMAREQEYVFETPPILDISATVVDAETGDPIPSFKVMPGVRSSPTHMNWVHGGSEGAFEAKDGKFRVTRNYGYLAHLLKVAAPGYLPAELREIKSDEGKVQLEFRLSKGVDVAASVRKPDGSPAIGAKVALGLAGSQISVTNGSFDDSTYASLLTCDKNGHFSFPPQGGRYQLVITHKSGYAYIEGAAGDKRETIRLTPWARVEGTFRVGGKPVGGVPLTLNSDGLGSYGKDVANIFAHHEAVSGKDGRFQFARVFPGKGWINRRILMTVSDGALDVTSASIRSIELLSGQRTLVEFGTEGRPVVGQLIPPEGSPPDCVWSFHLISVRTRLEEPGMPPYPGDRNADRAAYLRWRRDWSQTAAGREYQKSVDAYQEKERKSPRFRASIERDGSFRIDDVPPGEYRLTFSPQGARHPKAVTGTLTHEFSVPNDGTTTELQLPPLQLFRKPRTNISDCFRVIGFQDRSLMLSRKESVAVE